jgi:3-dehydroquinate synthase
MITVPVSLGPRSYEVRLGNFPTDLAADAIADAVGKASGVAILVDGNVSERSPRVRPLCEALAHRLPHVNVLPLAGGEACKTFAQLETTCQWLATMGYDRGAALVAIGGGAACDHTGFAAAIYMRGVDFVLCPTTLLALVDASVGGKTAVDLQAGKNLVGAFHQPRLVLGDLGFLQTLPAREQAAGMAEVVKAGLIADAPLFERLERESDALSPAALPEITAAAVRMKADVVARDERESNLRAILNFGHTLGHALEAASGFALLHGEAVSLGMIAALTLGAHRGHNDQELIARTRALLARLRLPVDAAGRFTPEVLARVEVDKKRRGGGVRFVFVPAPGRAVFEDIALADLREDVRTCLG